MKKYLYLPIIMLALSGCVKTEVIAEYLPYSFKVEGIAYNIISENNLTVAVTGAEKPSTYKGNMVIPSTVNYDNEDYTVTQIAYQAFLESNLNSLTIPESVNYIIDSGLEGSQIKNLVIKDSSQRIAVNKSLSYASIESAYIGRSISGNWVANGLSSLSIGKEVNSFSIQLTEPITITLEAEVPPEGTIEGSESVFNESVVYVPSSAIKAYEDSQNWGKFLIILAAD